MERWILWLLCIGSFVKSEHIVTLETIRLCENPSPPYPEPPTVEADIQIYRENNRILVRGNATVLTDNIFIKNVSVRVFEHDEVKYSFFNSTCRNVFVKSFLKMANVGYDETSCQLQKGVVSFNSFELNRFLHKGLGWMHDGKQSLIASLTAHHRTQFCIKATGTTRSVSKKKKSRS